MPLVKEKHQQVVESKIGELIEDLGKGMKVHLRATPEDCTWCEFSEEYGRSINKPASGVDWTTHPNYETLSTTRLCPNCLGRGTIQDNEVITVSDVIVSEIKGIQIINGRPALMPVGKVKITGKLSDIDSNKVCQFADNEYAAITNTSQTGLDITTGDMMIECWIKVDSSSGDRIITQKYDGTTGYKLYLNGENINILVSDGTDSITTTSNLASGTLVDNDWHHIAVTIDKSGTAKIYIDGAEISAYSSQTALTDVDSITNSADFYIAGNGTADNLIGYLDEIRIWSYGDDGLPSDIATIILNHHRYAHLIHKTADQSFLKGWWIMEELS